ncbi:dUTP diphosphatase [Aquibacillus rhizosphaerae]|uniref:dUTP diphosphatase n=1 Tax=Aquibacillus rhizosphaerae TaxID=3051431 RepID=A0ABT7L608_9BACI|nr:dUTP diphosphatase [Aquibacillus sp. LR5S19]MDL4840635.1 dUTP diphosphatase [Aquibacillus sp. LR5S19]
MNWNQLFTMQKQLDTYIQANHELENNDLFDKKILALLVEVGELANETRCFKFWSTKSPSEQKIVLEEYVDGIHFILSLGLDDQFSYDGTQSQTKSKDVTHVFNNVFEKIIAFKQQRSKENYNQLFGTYIYLGEVLGFDEHNIMQAYFEKNKVNFERQDKGY